MSSATQQAPQAAQGALGGVTNAASNLTGGLTAGGSQQGGGQGAVSDTADSAANGAASTVGDSASNVGETANGATGAATGAAGNAASGGTESDQEAEKKKKEEAELANKISDLVQNTIDKIKPTLKTIREHLDQADRDRQADKLDEEKVVHAVKPLIESATNTLQECHGGIKGLDSDGMLQKRAQANVAKREATPEEYRLSDLLKELAENVTTTIDESKRRLQDMPKAKKDLSPLLDLMGDPLFQILSAVGLLLSGVLGLLGNLLGGLGLGGIVKNLTKTLGLDKMLGGGK